MMTEEFEADCKRTAELIPKDERRTFFETACIEECSELIKVLAKGRRNGMLNMRDFIDEAGDVLNTISGVLREHGYTFNDAMAVNMGKRKKRHPTTELPAPAAILGPAPTPKPAYEWRCSHGNLRGHCFDCPE
jgi:NTP pyrophosphatase (non-canonical NTP hydrolase)